MAYDTIDKVHKKLVEYATQPSGASVRMFLVRCSKEKLQVIADLAPQTEEEFKKSMAILGLIFI